jgi:hypothetical protein
LVLEAFIRGVLDYKSPSRYNLRAQLKETWVLRRIEESMYANVRRALLDQQLAAAGGGHDANLFNDAMSKATEMYDSYRDLVIPYSSSSSGTNYRQMWEDHFGMKVGSPEYEKMLRTHETSYRMYKEKQKRRKE